MTESEIEKKVVESTIVLSMKVSEINQLLSIVGKYPFEEVQQLIRKIQSEGQPQINAIIAKLSAEIPEIPEEVLPQKVSE